MIQFPKSFFIAVIITLPSGNANYCPDDEPNYYSDLDEFERYGDHRIAQRFCLYPSLYYKIDGIHFLYAARTSEPEEFSYMCALGWSSPENGTLLDYKCGGALISLYFILTAGHCAYVNGKSPVAALVGGSNLTDTSAKIHYISKVFLHPDYNPNSFYHDIAIMQTVEPIKGTKIACLWTGGYVLLKDNLTVIGYGDTKLARSPSPILLKADLQAISNEECKEFYEPDFGMPDGIINKQLCANDPEQGRDACQGDSGGPLLMRKCENTFEYPFIVGITSYGIGCGSQMPGVYTRISEYLDWIEKIVWPGGWAYKPKKTEKKETRIHTRIGTRIRTRRWTQNLDLN